MRLLDGIIDSMDMNLGKLRELVMDSREGRDLGVAFQAPPGSQASSRGEAKDSALLLSRDAGLLEPPEWRRLLRVLWTERDPTSPF